MNWRPEIETTSAVEEFVETLVSHLPEVLGVDEIIPGCEVFDLDPGTNTLPREFRVRIHRYLQEALYRGGIANLSVGDQVTVIHMRDGNRYEVLTAGGPNGYISGGARSGRMCCA